MDKEKKTIKLYLAAPRTGKTRRICGDVLNNKDISHLGNLRRLFVVGMVGSIDSDDSTAISTMNTIKKINPHTTSVLLTSKVKICRNLYKNRHKIEDNQEYIKYLCSRCQKEKKFTDEDVLRIVNDLDCKILSFGELMKIYNEGLCPEVFSKLYSQYCEMSIISKSKLQSEMIYGGSIDIFEKYELIIDEAHSMFDFCDVSPICFKGLYENSKIDLDIVKKQLNELYYDDYRKFVKQYGHNTIDDLALSLIDKRINLLIELINKSLKRTTETMLSDDFFVRTFNGLDFLSDSLFNRAIHEKEFMKQTKLFKIKSTVDNLISLNGLYLMTDISNLGDVTLRFYSVSNNNGNKAISNPLKNKLFEESESTTLITSTPFYPEYLRLWFNSDDYKIRLISQEFTGKFYIFYHLGKCGVASCFNDKNLNRHQKLISVLSEEFDKSGDLYVLARSLNEKRLMEQYFYNFRNPPYDSYIGSVVSEGIQRNEKLEFLLGFAYTPVDDYRQSAFLFRNTIGKLYPVEKIRTGFVNMISAQRTVQSMFRVADIRDVRGVLIANLGLDELALIKRFPLSRDKNITFIEVPKNLRIEMYPKFIRRYIG